MGIDSGLIMALEGDSIKEIVSAVRARPNLDIEDEMGWTPLFYGVAKGDIRVVMFLLGAGADPRHLDRGGWTAAMHAALDGKAAIARVLEEATVH